jgi:hypothetical protein
MTTPIRREGGIRNGIIIGMGSVLTRMSENVMIAPPIVVFKPSLVHDWPGTGGNCQNALTGLLGLERIVKPFEYLPTDEDSQKSEHDKDDKNKSHGCMQYIQHSATVGVPKQPVIKGYERKPDKGGTDKIQILDYHPILQALCL